MCVLGIRKADKPVEQVDQQGRLEDLSAFMPRADFVVLALKFTPLTRKTIARRELQLMKPTATLINVARSQIVDLPAVCKALKAREIGQACLDVMPLEPWPQDDSLWDIPHLFITPHIAWSSPFFRQRAGNMWLENFNRYVKQAPLQNLIHQLS